MSSKWKKQETETERRFREKWGWRKVQAPKTWRPRDSGEELMGYYGGRTFRNGSTGQYEVVIVHVPRDGSYLVSGVKVMQLIDSALVTKGHPLRLIYKGDELLKNGHTMKQFDLLVAEGDPLREDELPSVEQIVLNETREPGSDG